MLPHKVRNKLPGGVSNVDIDGNNTLEIKAIGVVISTFETRPWASLAQGLKRNQCPGREGSSSQVRLAPLDLRGRRCQPEMMPQRRAGIVEPVQAAPL